MSSFTSSNYVLKTKTGKVSGNPFYTILMINPHCKLKDLLLFKIKQLNEKLNHYTDNNKPIPMLRKEIGHTLVI